MEGGMEAGKFHVYQYGSRGAEEPVFTIDGSRVFSSVDDAEPLYMIDGDRVLNCREGSRPSFYIRRNLWYDWRSGQPKYYLWPVE
jgi:hypothetical protein